MTPNAPLTAPPAPLPPNGDMARTHLITAAESLRVASERLCDYVEATTGDGHSRSDAPESSGNGPLAACPSSRRVSGQFVATGAATGSLSATNPDVATLAPYCRDMAPVTAPPPIPPGAVVEVEGDPLSPYTRVDDGWRTRKGAVFPDCEGYGPAPDITALYHARREREEARNDAAAQMMANVALANRGDDAIRERDAAREERDNATELRDELRRTLHRVATRVGVTVPLDHWHHDSVESAIGNMVEALEAECDAARRELAEALAVGAAMRKDAKRYFAKATENYERAANAERERDEKRAKAWEFDRIQRACPAGVDAFDYLMLLELAAAKDQGLGATARTSREAPNSEESDCERAVASPVPASAPCAHTHTSPNADTPHADVVSETAPLSGAGNTGETGKPRRWWLVVDREHRPRGTFSQEFSAVKHAEWVNAHTSMGPASVAPVIEARVTRETVERVAQVWGAQWPECYGSLEDMTVQQRARYVSNARAALSALGLTVEGDDNG